ncbi:hypothetical protein FOCC_FOCC017562, partial [Frankliniella occidentalis]
MPSAADRSPGPTSRRGHLNARRPQRRVSPSSGPCRERPSERRESGRKTTVITISIMAPMKKSASVTEQERHLENVATLLFHKGKLFSGADDGKIKMWSPDLKLEAEVQAHPVNVYSLAADGDMLYSSSNDGSIRSWNIAENLAAGPVVKPDCNVETMKLKVANDK